MVLMEGDHMKRLFLLMFCLCICGCGSIGSMESDDLDLSKVNDICADDDGANQVGLRGTLENINRCLIRSACIT